MTPGYWRPVVDWTPAYTRCTAEAARTAAARSAAPDVRAMMPTGTPDIVRRGTGPRGGGVLICVQLDAYVDAIATVRSKVTLVFKPRDAALMPAIYSADTLMQTAIRIRTARRMGVTLWMTTQPRDLHGGVKFCCWTRRV